MRQTLTLLVLTFAAAFTSQASGQFQTLFTYQGRLTDGGVPANGTYDLEVTLWNAQLGGSQLGSTFTYNNQVVTDGRFTIGLDFGVQAYHDSGRYLQIKVNGTTLIPRQPVVGTPYSIETRGISVNDAGTFVGVGRSSAVTSAEVFGLYKNTSGFGGMYVVTSGAGGQPFYGYSAGGDVDAYHYYDGASGRWFLYNGGVHLTVENTGDVGIGTTNPTARLDVEGTPGVDGIRFPDETLQTTAAPQIISAQVWIDPPNVLAGGSIGQTVTVAGVNIGDAIVANPGGTLAPSVGIGQVRVWSTDTIYINYINSGSVDRNPSGTWWQIRVIK